MPTLKDVELKISAVKKTKQITKAMNMVAASRLRGAQSDMDGFRPYAGKFSEVLGSLAEKAGEEASPLLVPRDRVKNVHIVMFTSDRGLCGGFNTNLQNKARALWTERKKAGQEVSVTCFGKKGRNFARKSKIPITDEYLGVVGGTFEFNVAANAARVLIDGFLEGTYDEVHLIYAEFISMAKQPPVIKQLLPIPPIEVEGYVGAEVNAVRMSPPASGVFNEKMKPELIEEFSLADLGTHDVRSFGELRLMSVSPTMSRATAS